MGAMESIRKIINLRSVLLMKLNKIVILIGYLLLVSIHLSQIQSANILKQQAIN
ncbi:MAG: hypothetical protein K0R15_2092 [Clostridiales bacterium]|jgi:hypothetical protein|nr:hypothetical protein [Clostridiales bacterium]